MRTFLSAGPPSAAPLPALFVGLSLAGCVSSSQLSPTPAARHRVVCVRGTTVDLTTGVAVWSGDFAVEDAPIFAANQSLQRFLVAPDDTSPAPRRQFLLEIGVAGPAEGTRQVRVTVTDMRSIEDLRAVVALSTREHAAEAAESTRPPSPGSRSPSDAEIGETTMAPTETDAEIARLRSTHAEFLWEPTPSGRTTLPLETPGDRRALRLTLQAAPPHSCARPLGMLADI